MKRNRKVAVTVVVAATVFLVGCGLAKTEEKIAEKVASVTIPFEWFRLEKKQVEEKPIPEITGIDLKNEKVDIEGLRALTKRVNEIGESLSDHEDYLDIASGEKTLYQVLGSGRLSLDYGSGEDGLTETVQDFAETEYQWIDSLTLRQYGVRLDKEGNRTGYAVVDVNGVNDTKDFHIQTLQLQLDDRGLPVSAIRIRKPEDLSHTRTPLSEDSFLESSTHQDFALAWERARLLLADRKLYDRIAAGEVNASHIDIGALTKQLGFGKEYQPTVFSLVKSGRGTFSHWAITGYLYDDTNLNATTLYELTVADESGLHLYTIHYHRGTKTITHITKGSPFKEE